MSLKVTWSPTVIGNLYSPLLLHTSMDSSQLSYETIVLSYVYGIMYYLIVLKYLLKTLEDLIYSLLVVSLWWYIASNGGYLASARHNKDHADKVPTITDKRQKIKSIGQSHCKLTENQRRKQREAFTPHKQAIDSLGNTFTWHISQHKDCNLFSRNCMNNLI